jgi:hypothetical protein
MKHSEITMIEALSMLDAFSPIKISLNGIVLYNDYDSEIEIEPDVYGEVKPWHGGTYRRKETPRLGGGIKRKGAATRQRPLKFLTAWR